MKKTISILTDVVVTMIIIFGLILFASSFMSDAPDTPFADIKDAIKTTYTNAAEVSDIQNGWWNKDESDTDIPPEEPDYDCDSEGHVYGEVNYVWNGYTSCVAQRTCSKCDYTQKEYAEIASSVLKTATCLEDGRVNSVATFTNAIFETQEKTSVVDKLGHNFSNSFTIDVKATCTSPGAKSKHCMRCDATKDATIIPATGHNPENGYCKNCGASVNCTSHLYGSATYTWNEPTICTAEMRCISCGYVYKENATITSTVTKEATCTENGIRVYTATFKNELLATQTGQETILSTGHSVVNGYCTICGKAVACDTHTYEKVSYKWNSYTSCVAEMSCVSCGYVYTENASITSAVTKKATCTESGTKTHTAIFQHDLLKTQKTQETVPATGHSVSNGVCTICGQQVACTTHKYSVVRYNWEGYTSCTAEGTCTRCGQTESENAKITSTVTTEAGCETEGVKVYTATFTNTAFKAQTRQGTIPATGHSVSNGYCVNCGEAVVCTTHTYEKVTYKWNGYTSCVAEMSCVSCGYVYTENASITSALTKAATCTESGTKTHTAIFQHDLLETQTTQETIPATGHSSSNGVCTICGEQVACTTHKYSVVRYTWNGYTSCTAQGTCTRCGQVNSEEALVTSSITKEASCIESGTRMHTATFQNESFKSQTTEETIPATGHQMVNGICTSCGHTEETNTPEENISIAGLYDANNNLVLSWEDSGINATCSNARTILANYPDVIHIVIPDSVTSIGNLAFRSCSNLKSVLMSDSVTSIGTGAFNGCSSLESITLSNNLTSIGGNAFNGCSSLTSITLPDSITSIGRSAFAFCTNLRSIKIPNSVTSIGEHTFDGCTNLQSVIIPDGVTSIGNTAFGNCEGLLSITIPNSVTNIDYQAFKGCISLTSVALSDGMTCLDSGLFMSCTSLSSITIPDSITSIGTDTFKDCTNLKTIYYSGTATGEPWGAENATVVKE